MPEFTLSSNINVVPLVGELPLLLGWRDGGVGLHTGTGTGFLLVQRTVLASDRVLGLRPLILVRDGSTSSNSLRDVLNVGGSETPGQNGGPGGYDLSRVDGGVELGPGEELLQRLLDDGKLGQASGKDDVRDGVLVCLGRVQGLLEVDSLLYD